MTILDRINRLFEFLIQWCTPIGLLERAMGKENKARLLDSNGASKILRGAKVDADDTSDRLLESSYSLLNALEEQFTELKEKATLLEETGFMASQLVVELKDIEKKRIAQEQRTKRLERVKNIFPNYRFIEHNDLVDLLAPYKMCIGTVSKFTGFVPKENLLEIKAFYDEYPDLKTSYFKKYYGSYGPPSFIPIGKNLYDFYTKGKISSEYVMMPTDLKICAFSYEVGGGTGAPTSHAKKFPHSEPIILLETSEYSETGQKGYIIITAWGEDLKYDPRIYKDKELIEQ